MLPVNIQSKKGLIFGNYPFDVVGQESVGSASWESRLGIVPWEPPSMTICIAAICDLGRTIVLAADKEFGIGYTSAEFPDGKFHPLYPDWAIGLADNVSNATDVIGGARAAELESRSVKHVRPAVEKAYRTARLARAEGEFLASRGWTLKDFQDFGSTKLPITTYSRIDTELAGYNFHAQLIVAGFGEGDAGPSIFTVTNPGVAVDNSKLGFWCIGSGQTAAQISLFGRKFSFTLSTEQAAYYVLEAKINAQQATGVDDGTHIFLFRKGIAPIELQPNTLKTMGYLYNRLKPGIFDGSDQQDLAKLDEFRMLAQSP
jgi:20S proteasome alpha/beta subunit